MAKPFLSFPVVACIAASLVWSAEDTRAQDPVFTQFDNNPLYLNPAFAGDHCWRVVSNSRTQWSQLSGRYQTSSLSVDRGFRSWGIGVQTMYDGGAAYTFQDLSASGLLSYRTRIGRTVWSSIGFRFNYHQRNIDPNKLLFRDQIETDGGLGFIYRTGEDAFVTRLNGTDVGAGLLLYKAGLWSVGFSGDHLADRNDGYDSFMGERWWIPRRLTAHASYFFQLRNLGRMRVWPAVTINPVAQVTWQAGFWERNVSVRLNRGPAVLGFGYRFNNAYTVMLGAETDRFGVNVSTDITTAKTTTDLPYGDGSKPLEGIVQPFTIEVSVQWRIRCETSPTRRKAIPCPSIWGEHIRPPSTTDSKGPKNSPSAPAGDSRFDDNVVPDRPR